MQKNLEEKANDYFEDAKTKTENSIKKGIFVFRAQLLLEEANKLKDQGNFDGVLGTTDKIFAVIGRENSLTLMDHVQAIIFRIKNFVAAADENMIDTTDLSKNTMDVESSLIDGNVYKAKGDLLNILDDFSELREENIIGWSRFTIIELNDKMEDILAIYNEFPKQFFHFEENPIHILTSYLEDIMNATWDDDFKGIEDLVHTFYVFFFQVERFLREEKKCSIPDNVTCLPSIVIESDEEPAEEKEIEVPTQEPAEEEKTPTEEPPQEEETPTQETPEKEVPTEETPKEETPEIEDAVLSEEPHKDLSGEEAAPVDDEHDLDQEIEVKPELPKEGEDGPIDSIPTTNPSEKMSELMTALKGVDRVKKKKKKKPVEEKEDVISKTKTKKIKKTSLEVAPYVEQFKKKKDKIVEKQIVIKRKVKKGKKVKTLHKKKKMKKVGKKLPEFSLALSEDSEFDQMGYEEMGIDQKNLAVVKKENVIEETPEEESYITGISKDEILNKLNAVAFKHQLNKDYDKAIEIYDEILEIDDEWKDVYKKRDECYLKIFTKMKDQFSTGVIRKKKKKKS